MSATRSLLQCLVVTGMMGSFMTASAQLGTGSVVTHTPPVTVTDEPPAGCSGIGATILIPKAEAVGELHTALDSASITYGVVPSVPCSVLAVLPSSLQDDFADLETRWYDWWQTQRWVTDFIFDFLSLKSFPCPFSAS